MDIKDIYADLSAFADDPNEVIVDKDGTAIIVRGGREISFTFRSDEFGNIVVDQDKIITPYRNFIAHNIAGLGTFAERLISKRLPVPAFVDGMAKIESVPRDNITGHALDLLNSECVNVSPFCSKVVFITADAGHGKTAVLREYQNKQAKKFLEGRSQFIFWHVDLQGRQLLRLHEALMGDLGELRISGIWMAGIIRLLLHRMLVLAIDGFDELAAEQGRTDALGALSTIVQQMQNKGVIVAASRRTFFDTEDYVRRTGLLKLRVSSDCEFDQIHLLNWTRAEDLQYLKEIQIADNKFVNPGQIYDEILGELQGDTTHPMLSKPFLLTHLAKGLLLYNASPSDFIKGMKNPLEGVAEVVTAFIKREVTEKWITSDTGEPYLSIEQHMQLLSTVAQEMWSGQTDRLGIEIIETITILLLEQWKIAEDRKRQVMAMVKMHVMLTIPSDGDEMYRSFDHPEFRNYFVAYFLSNLIHQAVEGYNISEFSSFLSIAQLPDGVAKYASAMLNRDLLFIDNIGNLMNKLIAREWKPTYLQTNIGTLLPCMIDGYHGNNIIKITGNIVFSSLVFENTKLNNIIISGSSFLNVSFTGVTWENIEFINCEFTDITLDKRAVYKDIRMTSCAINGVKLRDGDEEILRAYSPERIIQVFSMVGIHKIDGAEKTVVCPTSESVQRIVTNRLLYIFRRTTVISDSIIRLKIPINLHRLVYENIIPLMEKKHLIEPKAWRGGGKAQNLWVLKRTLDEISKADCGEGDPDTVGFWKQIDKMNFSS